MSNPNRYLDQEISFRGQYSKEVFQCLFFAYRPMLARVFFLVIGGFLGRLFLLSNANLIGVWVDVHCQRVSSADVAHCNSVPFLFASFADYDFLLLLIGVTLSGFILTAFYRIYFSRLSADAVSRIYDEVTIRTSRFPIKFFDTNPVGRVVTRFSSDYGNVFRLFGGPLAEFFAIIFDLACMLILVTIASPLFLPIIAMTAIANYFVYRYNRNRLREQRRQLSEWRSPSIAHFAESTLGASTIRIFGRQATFMKRFSRLNDRYLNQRIKTSAEVLKFSMQMSVLTALMLLGTGVAGYFMAQRGWVSIGSVCVAFTFIAFSGTSLQMFFEWFAQFEEAMTGVERLDNYLRRSIEPGAKLPAGRAFPTDHDTYGVDEERSVRSSRLVSSRSASVTVEDLWFRYAPNSPYVLKGLNFSIRPGEKIGIVGRTGSGKTSLVQAIFHLYPLEKGRVLIDGRAPNLGRGKAGRGQSSEDADLSVFRRGVALISQEPALFRGTIRDNLDLTCSHLEKSMLDVLDRVGLTEWLAAQPKGLNSWVEERGRNLSVGEKQLLCMARCLLQDAPVIVMDEATSSVDPQSEEILVRATREFFADRTQIIIAHRLSTLVHCDRILWLHNGEIKMFDRPEKTLPVFQTAHLC